MSPVLRQLQYWLPVRPVKDCHSRLPVLVQQCPSYVTDNSYCQVIADARVRQLRSADTKVGENIYSRYDKSDPRCSLCHVTLQRQ